MSAASLHDVWVYLAASPLSGLTATLLAYQAGVWLHGRCGGNPLVNPVLIAVTVLVAVLALAGIDYRTYFAGAQFVHFLLGPATVALAVPLYNQFRAVRRTALAMITALLVGCVTGAVGVVVLAGMLGASDQTLLSLAPKSATTPIAMGVAERIGGLPSLTAVFVILTGIIGATLGGWVMRLARIRDEQSFGFAMGTAAGGIGTARAFQRSEAAGAFSGLAMGLNGLATAVLVPLLHRLLW